MSALADLREEIQQRLDVAEHARRYFEHDLHMRMFDQIEHDMREHLMYFADKAIELHSQGKG